MRSQPGMPSQIAEALKIEPNYLYRVMPKLVSEGLITRDGQGGTRPPANRSSAFAARARLAATAEPSPSV